LNPIRTVGHGSLGADAFARLALEAGIDAIVDVRRFPGSRRHPHVRREEMQRWLGEVGLEYHWLPALGGRRAGVPGSPNVSLRNEQFRAYADHMGTEEFALGMTDLLAVTEARPAAVMCAESLWWHCHRRLLADHLVLVEACEVEHLFHDGRLVPHPPSPEARRLGDRVVYDLGVQQTLIDE
jgi:uncharacterized protein (DUF488 family)